ncbi:hypothetical protein DFH06DRAFT_1405999 [Mycena polygramma]|nr:hypothetical protein DFH06DRAFT_1405999 [Mycena polygramma]
MSSASALKGNKPESLAVPNTDSEDSEQWTRTSAPLRRRPSAGMDAVNLRRRARKWSERRCAPDDAASYSGNILPISVPLHPTDIGSPKAAGDELEEVGRRGKRKAYNNDAPHRTNVASGDRESRLRRKEEEGREAIFGFEGQLWPWDLFLMWPFWRALAKLSTTSRSMPCGNTVVNLLRCMPADIWESKRRGSENDAQFLRASDWDRALKYGRRIRSIRCCEHGAYHNWIAYANIKGQESLLPNFEALSWEHCDSYYCLFITVFLGPRLRSLRIGDQSDSGAGVLGMLGLKQRCPRLASVVVDGVRAGAEDTERRRLSRFLSSLIVVEVVDVGVVDCKTLIHLGQLTTVTTLRVDLPVAPSFSDIPEGSLYPNLRKAKIHVDLIEGASVSCLRRFVRTWNNSPMESFDAFLDDCAGLIYEELATHCVHERLQKLELKIYQRIRSFTHAGHILGPLFTFPNLCNLHIKVPQGYDMDDSTISDLAHAWPLLEHFVLRTHRRSHPCTTLLALYPLSQNCPHLATLEITLDASHIPPLPRHEAHVLQRLLVLLDVAFSPISDAAGVAAFLRSLFWTSRS